MRTENFRLKVLPEAYQQQEQEHDPIVVDGNHVSHLVAVATIAKENPASDGRAICINSNCCWTNTIKS